MGAHASQKQERRSPLPEAGGAARSKGEQLK
jgi:hypothetical protein